MARISAKVKNYTSGKCACNTEMSIFDTMQEVLNTMFDVRCSNKRKWGTDWYEYARYGCYEQARMELITKPACLSKTVALKCISDLEMLNAQMKTLEKEANK